MSRIIFTDCFNTIILRKASYKVVDFNWCEKLGAMYSIDPVVLYHFYNKYKVKNAIKNFFKTSETEIKFDEVVLQLGQLLKKNIENFDVSTFQNDALNTYIEAEAENHYINASFIEKLKNFKSEGAKIYVLSDFYCGKEVLAHWFKKLGIADLFDDIFVSCEFMASKRSTRLYKKIIKKLGINRKDITMFGDNLHADIICAKRVGIKSIRVHTKIEKSPKNFNLIKKFGQNYKKIDEIITRFGNNYNYSNHAFPFFLFTQRLCHVLEKNGVKNIFFLAREGLFLKKLFDIYCSITGEGKTIRTHYLEVSRSALYRINMKPLEIQDFTYIHRQLHKFSVYQLLQSLSFLEQEIKQIEKEIGENIKKKSNNLENSKTFKKLKESETFKNIYNKKMQEQEGVFDNYLSSFGVDFAQEGLDVVDVGWRGSMQDLLIEKLGRQINVRGWYMGHLNIIFSKRCEDKNIKSKKGLLFDMRGNKEFANKCFKPIFLDYEQICRADRNSVYGYKTINDKVKIIYEDKLDEKLLHQKYILPLQTQIENKFSDICRLKFKNLSIIEPIAVIKHMDIYRHLSKYDIDFYINAINSHYDNFGVVGIPKFSVGIKKFGFKMAAFFLKFKFMFFPKRRIFSAFYKDISKGRAKDL